MRSTQTRSSLSIAMSPRHSAKVQNSEAVKSKRKRAPQTPFVFVHPRAPPPLCKSPEQRGGEKQTNDRMPESRGRAAADHGRQPEKIRRPESKTGGEAEDVGKGPEPVIGALQHGIARN